MSIDWKTTLSTVAPVLASALGGPVAGAAINVIAQELLGDATAGEAAIAKAITAASPSDLIKLKVLDQTFEKDMAALGVDLARLEVEDRNSARDMAKVNMKPQIILSVIYTLGYIGVMAAFIAGVVNIPAETKTEFSMILGVLTAAQVQILNFWFGSSLGSKEKTHKLMN
jgi:hypothetical protein